MTRCNHPSRRSHAVADAGRRGSSSLRHTPNAAFAAEDFFKAISVTNTLAGLMGASSAVRGVKYSVTDGKTAELTIEQARKLLRSIDAGHIVGLRDRAVLGALATPVPASASWPDIG
jgi:hypothetical protein